MYRKFDVTENLFLYSAFLEELNTAYIYELQISIIFFPKNDFIQLLLLKNILKKL
jgi:hypothetical protein